MPIYKYMKKNKLIVLIILLDMVVFTGFAGGKKSPEGKPISFDETWGYVSMTRASEYNDELPLTDVCYFAADVNCYGELIDIPDINKIKVTGKRRHMVFICDSKSLTHFILSPEYPIRERIISELLDAVKPFDGLNIDIELVPARDSNIFLSFIAELSAKLPDKMLSVCVPARVKRYSEEVYPYKEIADLCDRVFIMAYDEHWSGGKPGPIATPDWCKNVTSYAKKSIPQNKIIMGIPFYGRTWANKTTSGAWYYSGAQRVMNENDVDEYSYEKGIPHFSYTTEVTVQGYINDAYSVYLLAQNYEKDGITKIGYWRIGQEDPEVWDYLKVKLE